MKNLYVCQKQGIIYFGKEGMSEGVVKGQIAKIFGA